MMGGRAFWKPTTAWLALGALVLGYLLGQATADGGSGSASARQTAGTPTATLESEREELAALRTQVAELSSEAVCTPAPRPTATARPSPTATATPVPPVAAGQPLPYGDGWTVVVSGFSLVPAVGEYTAAGKFAVVGMNVTNDADVERSFDFWSLRLVDDSGRVFEPTVTATVRANTSHPNVAFVPGIARDIALAFDVAADAGEIFILESAVDPSFRVQVAEIRLG